MGLARWLKRQRCLLPSLITGVRVKQSQTCLLYHCFQRKIAHPALKFLGRALFFSMGFMVTVKGKIASPSEAPIFVVAPHSTFFDGIACVVAGLPSLVSRNENAQTPLVGSKYL